MAEKRDVKKRISARDVLRVAFRYRGLFAIGTALFAVPALVAMPHLPQFEKKYTGTAIFEQRTDAATQTGRREATSFEEAMKPTLMHDLAGRSAMETAIEELGLTRGLPRGEDGQLTREGQMTKQQLVKDLTEQVKVRQDVNTQNVNLVSVSFTDANPERAQELPNTLVRDYITRASDIIVKRLTDSRDFLEGQVENAEKKLGATVTERSNFESQNGGFLPDNPSALHEKMQELSADIDSIRRQNTVASQKLERIQAVAEEQKKDTGEPIQTIVGPNPEIDRLKEQKRNFEEQLQNARTISHMTDKHPTVEALVAKITNIENTLVETPEEVELQKIYGTKQQDEAITMALAAAKAEVDMTESELARLQNRLDTIQNLIGNYGPVRQRYMELIRKTAEAEIEKKNWQERFSEVEMALSAEVAKRRTHLNAAQLAQEQFVPSEPKLSTMLGMALVGGLMFGGGLVFLSNLLDRSVADPRDAEAHFGLPVYGVIGEIVPPPTRAWRNVRRFAIEPVVGLVLLAGIGIAALNVALWLQNPVEYAQWTAAPLAYLGELAGKVWPAIRQKF